MFNARIRAIGLLAAATLAILPGVGLAQTTPRELTPEQKTDILAAVQKVVTEQAFVPGADLSKWPTMIEKKKEELDKAKTDEQFAFVVNRSLDEFGFSHMSLMPPAAGTARQTQKRVGIGIRIEIEPEQGLRVMYVFKGSPADEAGIKMGDLVFESDGKPVRGVADLAGEEGDKSKIKIKRGDEVIELEATRRPYSTVVPETLEWKGDAAILTVPTFDVGYDRKNIDSLMEQAMKAKTLVVDLRSNGGGSVASLMHLLSHFLPNEPIGTFINRTAIDAYKEAKGEETTDPVKLVEFSSIKVRPFKREAQFQGKVAVLTSGATGSASEMFAAAMKELRGGESFGSRTAGAVLASNIIPLKNGHNFWIQFPLLDYVTIKGLRLEGNGVKPLVEAPVPTFNQEDKALSAAIKWGAEAVAKAG